jgi:hypothetical protein
MPAVRPTSASRPRPRRLGAAPSTHRRLPCASPRCGWARACPVISTLPTSPPLHLPAPPAPPQRPDIEDAQSGAAEVVVSDGSNEAVLRLCAAGGVAERFAGRMGVVLGNSGWNVGLRFAVSCGQAFEVLGRRGQVHLDLNVAQSPPCGTPQAMAGFRFVMDSCGTPAVPVVEPQLVRRPAGVTAAGAGLWLRCWGGALEDAARGRFACRCERTARSPLSRGARRKPPVGFEPTTCGLQNRCSAD